ncbi:hypothetical protein, partial [Pseudomonas sp. RSP]
MTILRKANAIFALALSSSIAFGVVAPKNAFALDASDRKTLLYVGIAPCNNGEVTTFEKHKGCATNAIGYTIDDASAVPAENYIEVFSGNDVGNNKMVSKDSDTKNGSTQPIGYLSKNPIPHGTIIYTGV